MSITRTFANEEWEALGLPDACEGGEIIEDRMVDHRRWYLIHEITFRVADQAPGEAYRARYKVPATECQEVDTPESYEAIVVRGVQKMVTVYEPAPADTTPA